MLIILFVATLAVFSQAAVGYRLSPECTEAMKNGLCPKNMDPICASDGRTYNNECVFCYEVFRLGLEEDLYFSHWGACNYADVPNTKCTDDMKQGCSDIYDPVCGTNGVTYDNLCKMCQKKFHLIEEGQDKDDLRVANVLGSCRDVQERMRCTPDMKNHNCPDIYKPVCALHGWTYKNACEICSFMYEVIEQMNTTEVYIGIIHEGECKHNRTLPHGCSTTDFLIGSNCYWSPPLAPICQQPKCSDEYAPVCGTDGNTYESMCNLCFVRFMTEAKGIPTSLELEYDGRCH